MVKSKSHDFLSSIYDFIEQRENDNLPSPAISELIDAGFATSSSVVIYYLNVMEGIGMLRRIPRIARGIRLVPRNEWPEEIRDVAKESEEESEHI